MVNKKLIFLAVFLSLAAAGSVFWYLSSLTNEMDTTVYANTVAAVVDIPKNTVVTGDMVKEVKVPQEYVHPEAVTKVSEAVGRISTGRIYAGEYVISRSLVEQGQTNQGLAYAIPKGKRAVSIAINEVSGVTGLVMPGDKVDIVVTLDLSGVTQTGYILQGIPVLAVGRKLDAQAETWAKREGMESTFTLAVTPKEAQPLVLASERGSIRLLLRPPVDDSKANLMDLRLNDLLRGGRDSVN